MLVTHEGAVHSAPLQRRADLGPVLRRVAPPGPPPRRQRRPRARQLRPAASQLPVLGHDGCVVAAPREAEPAAPACEQQDLRDACSASTPASTAGLSCLPATRGGSLGCSWAAQKVGSGGSSSASSSSAVQSSEAAPTSAYGGVSQAAAGRSTNRGESEGRRAARSVTREGRVGWVGRTVRLGRAAGGQPNGPVIVGEVQSIVKFQN